MHSLSTKTLLMIALLALVPCRVLADEKLKAEQTDANPFPAHVYWGDTHVHSSWSPDAGGSGLSLIHI